MSRWRSRTQHCYGSSSDREWIYTSMNDVGRRCARRDDLILNFVTWRRDFGRRGRRRHTTQSTQSTQSFRTESTRRREASISGGPPCPSFLCGGYFLHCALGVLCVDRLVSVA